MRAGWALVGLVGLAACNAYDASPTVAIPKVCEGQVDADPLVKSLTIKGLGSDNLRLNTENQLRYARIDAAHRCMQQKGLVAPGGGVERQRITS